MEAKELRIGNLIYDKLLKFNDKIDIISLGRILNNKESFHRYKPIPLTEEWLLKFGFEKRVGWDDMIYYSKDAKAEFQVYENLQGYEYDYTKLKFVHQLQNLYFALNEEEI